MNAYIERDHCTQVVRVWLYRQEIGGTVFMWPSGREHNAQVWTQEIVPEGQVRPEHIPPAIEMGGYMWEAFVKALRAVEFELPAGKLLAKVLEREQNRVDALIAALIKMGEPQMFITSTGEST